MKGQRWVFDIGNSRIVVDNGYSRLLWGQERLVVNGETVRATGGWFRSVQRFPLEWLTPAGEQELLIRLRIDPDGIDSIRCEALLGGVRIRPSSAHRAEWAGPKWSWPEEGDWKEP